MNSLRQFVTTVRIFALTGITRKKATKKKWPRIVGGGLLGCGAILLYTMDRSVKAYELVLHPPKLPWSHSKYTAALDHASIKRGYEVYKNVCSACHSLRYVCYRELIGVSHTEEEAKREAEEQIIEDGPNEEGLMFKRPGKLSDSLPKPYPNEEAARFANNGAYPPDLTYIVPARHGKEDYIFHYLTGYRDPPEGIVLREGQYYNPYFAGGATSMADPLYNNVLEFSDGTKPTKSQVAKDVVTFLKWASEPEHDLRKTMTIKALIFFSITVPLSIYWKRMKWSTMKSRQVHFVPPKKK